jgi:hypothetical protein
MLPRKARDSKSARNVPPKITLKSIGLSGIESHLPNTLFLEQDPLAQGLCLKRQEAQDHLRCTHSNRRLISPFRRRPPTISSPAAATRPASNAAIGPRCQQASSLTSLNQLLTGAQFVLPLRAVCPTGRKPRFSTEMIVSFIKKLRR